MKRRRLLMAIAPAVLSGCSLWPQAASDEPTLHLLDARPVAQRLPRRDAVLAVSPPRAAAGFDSAAMVYVRQEHALERYATHRWADTPARMIAPLLLRTLEDSGAFRAVVNADAPGGPGLRLDTEIVQLRHSFLRRPSRVELTLRAVLVDATQRRVLATRYLEHTQVAASDDAPGGVAAANAAVAAALAELARWCVDSS